VPKILFACGRELDYVRNVMVLRALRANFDVMAVTESRLGSLTLRLAVITLRLLRALRRPHDLVYLGFYAHPLVPLARRLTSAPILFDAFVSTYDTLCFDRQVLAPGSPGGRLAFRLDQAACAAATTVLLDTQAHAGYFRQTFGLRAQAVQTLYLGCDESLFYPRSALPSDAFTVLFYGTYQPLHGVETIIRAAARLAPEQPIRFRLIGDGATYRQARALAERLGANNVEFCNPVPFARLPDEIARADVCLGGPFGSSGKAQRVITGKTFQFLAMGKPTIVSDTPANRELLEHGRSALMCPQADPESLAETIHELYRNLALRQAVGSGGLALFRARLTASHIAHDLADIIQRVMTIATAQVKPP
jgi:glycosyltransferase involved in cell wall biosynthesis